MSARAEYLVVLNIKDGMPAPTIEAVGAALEVGTDDPPEEMGFGAVEQIIVKEPRRGFLVDEREHATVLAALRWWQDHTPSGEEHPDLHDIATNVNTLEELDSVEIDELCERLNTEPVADVRLNRAAPDLLAALKDLTAAYAALPNVFADWEGDAEQESVVINARAAIAKATTA
jgi:hypothetical protein